MVLERDKGDRDTRVAAEPELEGDVERLRRRAGTRKTRLRDFRGRARGIKRNTATRLEERKVVRVANERVKSSDRTGLRRELRPDLHPVTVLAIDALTTDFNLNLLHEAVTDVVHPAERRRRIRRAAARRVARNLGENDLNVRLVHEVRVTVDYRCDALVEVRLSVECNFNGFYGEVRVALV